MVGGHQFRGQHHADHRKPTGSVRRRCRTVPLQITGALFFSTEATIPRDRVCTNVGQDLQLCESETRLSTQIYFGAGAIFGSAISGVHYSYKTQLGSTSFTTQQNYYGTGLFARSLYVRSGYGPAKTLADTIDENWINDPEVCAGFCINGTFGIRMAGGFIGAVADKVTNPNSALSWDHLRNFGTTAAAVAASGNPQFRRFTGYGRRRSRCRFAGAVRTAQQATWNGILYSNPDFLRLGPDL